MNNYFNKVQWTTFYLRDDYELKNHFIVNWQLYLYVCSVCMCVYSFQIIAELKMSIGETVIGPLFLFLFFCPVFFMVEV